MCHKGVEAFLARALNAAGKEHKHPKEVTSPEEAKTWLPLRLLNACLNHGRLKIAEFH